jgi:dienelactone hydrolase
VVVHDAFGRGEPMIGIAERLAGLGFAVLAADVWGDAFVPTRDDEIGSLMGAMIGDRAEWRTRVRAAHDALARQPEVDPNLLGSVGFCFGGSSALEYLRQGGALRGVVSIHGGLDLLLPDWSAASADARVLVCSGAADPMASRDHRHELLSGLDSAGIPWELDLYAGVKHAFTNPWADRAGNPDVFAYDEWASMRALAAMDRFFVELFA